MKSVLIPGQWRWWDTGVSSNKQEISIEELIASV
jgi:hypothetical protein